MQRPLLTRSVSEPSHVKNTSLLTACSISRDRSKESVLSFEQGKDCIAVWLNKWNRKEVCCVLEALIRRCPLNQLHFLWTALECVPHRDFLYNVKMKHPSIPFQPLSTPISRHYTGKLTISRRHENKMLHRTQSLVVDSKVPQTILANIPAATDAVRLPGLRPSTDQPGLRPDQPGPRLTTDQPMFMKERRFQPTSLRLHSSERRHMSITLSHIGSPSCYATRPSTVGTTHPATRDEPHHGTGKMAPPTMLPAEGLKFLSWFTSLDKEWQQQDVLQMFVWSLDQRELYYLVTVLLSRQYRDFVKTLPEKLALKVLSHVPGKDLLVACGVSKCWYKSCSGNELWKIKCSQIQLGLPPIVHSSWKQLFIDDIRLKRNWRLGRAGVSTLVGHQNRVLCVMVKEGEDLCASGGADHSVKIWDLKKLKLKSTLYGHTKPVWCLCFYGHNLLISGSSDCTVRVWNYAASTCERSMEGHSGTVWCLARRGDYLITGSHDNTAIVWNIRQCKYIHHLCGHTGAVFSVDIDDGIRMAYTGSGDKTVRVWRMSDGTCLHEVQASQKYSVISLHYSKGLLATALGPVVVVWSVPDFDKVLEFKGHDNRVECVHLLCGGSNANTVVSCSKDGLIKYWNVKSGRCIRTLEGHSEVINYIHRDNTYIVSASNDKTIRVWNFHPHFKLSSKVVLSRPTTPYTGNRHTPQYQSILLKVQNNY